MKSPIRWSSAIAITIAVSIGDAAAQTAPTTALLFKSGQAYLERSMEVDTDVDEGHARLRLPTGIHGTIWLGSNDVALSSATASLMETEVERPVQDMIGLLRCTVGRTAMITFSDGAPNGARPPQSLRGRVVRLIGPTARASAGSEIEPAAPKLIVIELERGQGTSLVCRPIEQVIAVADIDPKLDMDADEWTYSGPVQHPVLDITYRPLPSPPASGAKVTLASMANGLAWAPSYSLELRDGGRARLVGKAILVNDLEDLVDTNVRLVVGHPHLKFAGVPSVLLPEIRLDQFRALLERDAQPFRGVMNNPMSQVMSNSASFERASFAPSGPEASVAGEVSEDLYIYEGGRITLAKGARAYLPLLAHDISCEHRYDWDLPNQVDSYARFVDRSNEEPTPVWHVLRLTNSTSAPWTTAPVIVQGTKGPLAQSTIEYTAPTTTTTVRLTMALGLVGSALEYRADSVVAPRTEVGLFGDRFERIDVKGKLELRNLTGKTTPLRIKKSLSGDVVEVSGEPVVTGEAEGLGQVNAARTLTWSLDLAANATWTTEYTYRVLIRR